MAEKRRPDKNMAEPNSTFFALRRQAMEKRFSNMNPSQKEAVFQTKGPLLILAGAGSGKTTVIINRIAGMVKFGDAYHSPYLPENPESAVLVLQDYLDGGECSDEMLAEIGRASCRERV